MGNRGRKKKKIKARFWVFLLIIFFIVLNLIKIITNTGGDGDVRSIVIDAGHGDQDPGTIAVNGAYEKDLVLSISKKLNKKLKKKGYKTIMIRDDDQYVENMDRARIANNKKADLYLSIHGNAMENNPEIKGIQVLYYPGKDNEKKASIILNSILNTTGAVDKGIIEREDLIILNQTTMPAFLLEVGFLSNQEEAEILLDKAYQDKIVEGIISGINGL